jgi:tRNA nucleotidyltransferase (CCA-adding enzyme)
MNSLFYDIKLECVRDDTGLGVNDLQNKIIRTPIPPQYTFQADPIRIFRAVWDFFLISINGLIL